MMPKVDGYKICKFIRGRKETKVTKVVFLNNKSKKEDIENADSFHANLYIPKPFSTRDFVKKINMLVSEVI